MALRLSTSEADALKYARKLTGQWANLKAHDPLEYARGIAAALQSYPLGVVEECCDVRTGLAREREFPPTVQSVIEWCDKRVKQHTGAIIWAKKDAEQKRQDAVFTDEHRQSMLQRLKVLMHGLFDKQPQGEPAE